MSLTSERSSHIVGSHVVTNYHVSGLQEAPQPSLAQIIQVQSSMLSNAVVVLPRSWKEFMATSAVAHMHIGPRQHSGESEGREGMGHGMEKECVSQAGEN